MWVTPKFAANSFFAFDSVRTTKKKKKSHPCIFPAGDRVLYRPRAPHLFSVSWERQRDQPQDIAFTRSKGQVQGWSKNSSTGLFFSAVLDAFYITSVVSFSLLCIICNPLDAWSLVRDLVPPVYCAHCKHLEWIVDSYKHRMQWRK